MRYFDMRAAIVAAILGLAILDGCVVVDDPQHCANREGDRTCAELYAPGVHCSACARFYNGCVDDEPEPECRVDDVHDADESGSSEDEGSSSDAAAIECEACSDEDAGGLEAVR